VPVETLRTDIGPELEASAAPPSPFVAQSVPHGVVEGVPQTVPQDVPQSVPDVGVSPGV